MVWNINVLLQSGILIIRRENSSIVPKVVFIFIIRVVISNYQSVIIKLLKFLISIFYVNVLLPVIAAPLADI